MSKILIQFASKNKDFQKNFPFIFTNNMDYYFESFKPQYEQAAIIGKAPTQSRTQYSL
jgi:hypothetical protein